MKFPKKWIEPCIHVVDAEERRKVRLLAIIIICNCIAVAIILAFFIGFPRIADPKGEGKPILELCLTLAENLLFYLLARTRFYKYACAGMIINILATITYITVVQPTVENVAAGSV